MTPRDEWQKLLAPVISDLERDHPGLLRVEWRSGDDGIAAHVWDGAGSGTGIFTDSLESADDQIYVAEIVQEAAIEALWGEGKPATWPHCPHHPNRHPLALRPRDGNVMWTCPATDQDVAPLGRLGEAADGR